MKITVSFDGLEALASDIASQATTLQGTLENLQSRIKPVVAQWDGSSSEAYASSQAKWDQAAEDLQQVLAQIATAVRTAAGAFREGEQANTNRW